MKKYILFIIKDIYRAIISVLTNFISQSFIQYKRLMLFGLIYLFLISFTLDNHNRGLKNLYKIDLTNLPEKENRVYLSRIATGISYLPLESKKESLIGPGVRFNLFDSIIVSSAHQQILLFDSKNGKFLRPIGEYGRGPNGYINCKSSYLRNGEIIITALGWNYPLIEFSTKGEILNKFKFEERPRDIAWLSGNLYAVYYYKQRDSDTLRVVIYDSGNNKIISSFYDKRIFNEPLRRTTDFGAFFYSFKGGLFLKEYFNDTVFHITRNHLTPSIFFKSGKFSPPFYEKDTFDFVEYHNIRNILETDNFIFFQLFFRKRGYFCYFDKRTNQVMIPNYKNLQINGFENDIDGFMPFHPVSLSNRNELIGFLEPYQMKIWFKENPDKARKLPQHIQRLNNIDEMDNPVVMIVKLKE
jgi:hypothetical protein